MTLTVGSLFSGVGGLDLGLERAGMTVAWQSEIDPHACRVLAKHWPNVPNLGDVTSINWSDVAPVDLICGGYPCQPFSFAGQRRGEADSRHLWPYVADAIRHLRPRYALMENVAGHLSLGFGRVLGDLAEIGYDAEWSVVSACALGAPHARERVFLLAYSQGRGRDARGRGVGQAPAVPLSTGGSDGPPDHGWWTDEPSVDRVVDGIPDGVDRRRALGNAVVPQVAEWIGRQIVAGSFPRPLGELTEVR